MRYSGRFMRTLRLPAALLRTAALWPAAGAVVLLASATPTWNADEWKATLNRARAAMTDGVPAVAVHALAPIAQNEGFILPDQRVEALLLLAEALHESGNPTESLGLLTGPELQERPEAALLSARVHAAVGSWDEALEAARTAARFSETRIPGTIAEAEALAALGEPAEAAARLESLAAANELAVTGQLHLASARILLRQRQEARAVLARFPDALNGTAGQWLALLRVRLLLLDGRVPDAATKLQSHFPDPAALRPVLRAAFVVSKAQVATLTGGPDAGVRYLEEFISQNEAFPILDVVFHDLGQRYLAQTDPSLSELRRWESAPPTERAMLAKYYLGVIRQRNGQPAKAERSFADFLGLNAGLGTPHPLTGEVYRLRAAIAMDAQDIRGAIAFLDAALRTARSKRERARIEFDLGALQYRNRDYPSATRTFGRVGELQPAWKNTALFNAAMAQVAISDNPRFDEWTARYIAQSRDSEGLGDLLLERGLQLARANSPEAAQRLRTYLRLHPAHSRRAEGLLAVAELAYTQGDPETAEEFRRSAVDASPGIGDAAEALRIFLEDQRNRPSAEVARLATEYLTAHPNSPAAPSVRMKLAEMLTAQGNHAAALTEYAAIAALPDGPYAETALYQAGMSAMKLLNPGSMERALEFFEQVVRMDRSLKPYARYQEGVIMSRRGRDTEATGLFQEVLSDITKEMGELYYATHCALADSLATAALREPAFAPRAIAAYGQLLEIPNLPREWLNQGRYKRAKLLEQIGQHGEAVTGYYELIKTPQGEQPEWFWYYKGGFDAANLLQTQKDWKSAVGIYEELARANGPRANEARQRSRELKLRNFVLE